MSAIKAWFIACNTCGEQMCSDAIPPYETKGAAEAYAKKLGWFVGILDIHLCPGCRNPVGAKSARTQRRNIARNRAAGLTDYGQPKTVTNG